MTQTHQELREEFEKSFGRGGFGDTKIFLEVEEWLSQKLEDQKQRVIEMADGMKWKVDEHQLLDHMACEQHNKEIDELIAKLKEV